MRMFQVFPNALRKSIDILHDTSPLHFFPFRCTFYLTHYVGYLSKAFPSKNGSVHAANMLQSTA